MTLRHLALAGALFTLFRANSVMAQVSPQGPIPLDHITAPGFRSPVPGRWLPVSETQSGVPLGGLGTGYLDLRPDGRFYEHRMRTLASPESAPDLRLSLATSPTASVTLLASKDLAGQAPAPHRYFGHFPMVDLDYGRPMAAPVSVWCRAFSPFVPGAADLSNMPAAVFTVRLKNESSSPLQISLRLTRRFTPGSETAAPFSEKEPDVKGLLITSTSATLALAALKSGWTASTHGSTGVEVSGRLPAKAEERLTMIFAWRLPSETARDGKLQIPHYAARFSDAAAVARAAAADASSAERRIVAFQQTVYDATYPDWLKDALINSLSLLAEDTAWFGDGLYLTAQQGGVIDSVGSRLDGGLALLRFFPELELQALRRLASRQAETGEIPGRLAQEGSLGAPQFGPGRTHASAEFVLCCQRAELATGDRAFAKEIMPAVKRAMEFAMTLDTDSDGLIEEPTIPRSLSSLDRYRRDWLWHGISSYTAFIGLAALRAAEEMAKDAEDTAFAERCHQRFESGRRSVEENLWNGRYYRLYTDPDGFRQSDSVYLAELAGQGIAWLLDLGDLATRSRTVDSLQTAGRWVSDLPAGEVGVGISSQGKPDETGAPFSTSMVPRDVWLYAATALFAAEISGDTTLRDVALACGERAYLAIAGSGTMWRQHGLYNADRLPTRDSFYFGNLAIWMLPDAMEGRPLRPKSLSPKAP